MKSFLLCSVLLVIVQLMSCSPTPATIKRSEVGSLAKEDKSSEKFLPGFLPPVLPPPLPLLPPPPPHPFFGYGHGFGFHRHWGWHHRHPFGWLKDEHKNEKRSEVGTSSGQSSEKDLGVPSGLVENVSHIFGNDGDGIRDQSLGDDEIHGHE